MAKTTFKNISDEDRELHGSWDHIARLVMVVTLISVVVWGVCTVLRLAVHTVSHEVLHYVEDSASLLGAAVLLAGLVAAGIVRGLLVRREGWEQAAGDGMEVALGNYHVTYDREGDDPQPRYDLPSFGLAAKKSAMTLLTLGPGGSGGLEAPTVLIGESMAAGVSRVMQVRSEFELRTYQLAGIAAAVGTLLGAPFTAALFATEVAYGDRIIYRKLAYGLWAGVVTYILNNRMHGYTPLFPAPDHGAVYSLAEYAATAIVAVAVSAPAALAFGWIMTHTRRLVARVRPVLHGAVTSAGVGLTALGLWWIADIAPHHVLAMGEETLFGLLENDPEIGVWWVLLLLLGGKLVTTSLTLSGGGSAGLLVPSMYVGGVSGALVAHVLRDVGAMPDLDPALFAVVGIASALVAVVGVPLASIALVLEVFGKAYGPPAILACGVTYLVTLKFTLYETQRASPDPHGDETG